jgi:hypothetical protein
MKIMKLNLIPRLSLGISCLAIGALLTGCEKPTDPGASATSDSPKPPNATMSVLNDGVGAKAGRVDNMHKTRFIEIFFAHRDAKTGKLVAECYNTMFTSQGIPASKDTAPQALVEGLDFAKLKTDYGVLGASLNGPKLWTSDWTEIDIGVEREFNGIKAAWVAQLSMGDNACDCGIRHQSRWHDLGAQHRDPPRWFAA